MQHLRDSPSRWGRLQQATPDRAPACLLWCCWLAQLVSSLSGQLATQTPFRLLRAICVATAEILFLRGIGTGALLLTAMLLQPSVLILGLTSVLAAALFTSILQLDPDDCTHAPLLFNPLLAGLGVGYLFQVSVPALFLAAVAGILTFLLTWALAHILKTFLWLPVLSLPFILVSWVVHLAAFRYAGLAHAFLPDHAYTIGLAPPLELNG